MWTILNLTLSHLPHPQRQYSQAFNKENSISRRIMFHFKTTNMKNHLVIRIAFKQYS